MAPQISAAQSGKLPSLEPAQLAGQTLTDHPLGAAGIFAAASSDNATAIDSTPAPVNPGRLCSKESFTLPTLSVTSLPHSNLSTPQCSNGQSQSRPFPARPVKIMESARQHTQPNAAGGSGGTAAKPNATQGGPKGHATALDLCVTNPTPHVTGDSPLNPCACADTPANGETCDTFSGSNQPPAVAGIDSLVSGKVDLPVTTLLEALPPRLLIGQMNRVCGYCRQTYGHTPCEPEHDGKATHGICPGCAAVVESHETLVAQIFTTDKTGLELLRAMVVPYADEPLRATLNRMIEGRGL